MVPLCPSNFRGRVQAGNALHLLPHQDHRSGVPHASVLWRQNRRCGRELPFPPRRALFSPNPAGYPGRDFSLDTLPQEYSGSGAGDFRLSSLAAGHGAVDLHYVRHRIVGGKPALAGLPSCCAAPEGWKPWSSSWKTRCRAVCQAAVRCVRGGRFFTRSAVIINRGAAPHPCTGP